MTTEQRKDKFIQQASAKYNYYYDYSKVNFTNQHTAVTLVCPKHGEFLVLPSKHMLRDRECKICKHVKQFPHKTPLDQRHNKEAQQHKDYTCLINKFPSLDFSKFVWGTGKSKSTVICKIHGEFQSSPSALTKAKHGCKKCGELSAAISKQKDLTSFITKAQSIHGDKYDYTKSVYKSAKEKITITCPDHGDFEQLVSGHLSGYGCKHCASHGKGRVDMSKPCTLYYLHLPDLDYYKIGITSLSVDHRYRTAFDREQFTVVFTKLYPTGREAYEEEQKLLNTFSHLKHVGAKVLSAGNTEIFTKDIFNGDYTIYTTKAI